MSLESNIADAQQAVDAVRAKLNEASDLIHADFLKVMEHLADEVEHHLIPDAEEALNEIHSLQE